MMLEVVYTLSTLILVTGLNCTNCTASNQLICSPHKNCTQQEGSSTNCTAAHSDNCTLVVSDGSEHTNCTGSKCSLTTGINCTDAGYTRIQGICVKGIALNEHCETEASCQAGQLHSECNSLLKICMCRPGYQRIDGRGGTAPHCKELADYDRIGEIDLGMVFILVLLCLMFIIICIVFQMFARARFQENRTIFNTANPRLMNASFSAKDMIHRRKNTGSTSEDSQEERKRKIQDRIRSTQGEEETEDV